MEIIYILVYRQIRDDELGECLCFWPELSRLDQFVRCCFDQVIWNYFRSVRTKGHKHRWDSLCPIRASLPWDELMESWIATRHILNELPKLIVGCSWSSNFKRVPMNLYLSEFIPFIRVIYCPKLNECVVIVLRDPCVKYRLIVLIAQTKCVHSIIQMFHNFSGRNSWRQVANV